MVKVFRPWDLEQSWLLPPSVQELVPPRHPAHLVREFVRTQLDLIRIFAAYDEERGYPPYHPAMMTALLLYGCTQGLFSSRKRAQPRLGLAHARVAHRLVLRRVTADRPPGSR